MPPLRTVAFPLVLMSVKDSPQYFFMSVITRHLTASYESFTFMYFGKGFESAFQKKIMQLQQPLLCIENVSVKRKISGLWVCCK